jgi:hypothetical protein
MNDVGDFVTLVQVGPAGFSGSDGGGCDGSFGCVGGRDPGALDVALPSLLVVSSSPAGAALGGALIVASSPGPNASHAASERRKRPNEADERWIMRGSL